MKPLRLDLRLALEALLVEFISVRFDPEAILMLQNKARGLQRDIEHWYIRCQDEGITGNGDLM